MTSIQTGPTGQTRPARGATPGLNPLVDRVGAGKRFAGPLLAVLAISAVEAAAVYALHRDGLGPLVAAARGVVLGTPHWRVYQNRLLGPYLIEACAWATGASFAGAYLAVMAGLIALKNAAVWRAARAFRGGAGGLVDVAAGAAIFVLLQNSWLYPWDPIDVAVSAGIIGLAAGGDRPRAGALLFLVALLNRESSAFVGLWTILDAVVLPGRRLPVRLGLADPRKLAVGLAMIGCSALVAEALRRLLFIRQIGMVGPNGLPGAVNGADVQLQLFQNLRELTDSLDWSAGVRIPAFELCFALLVLLVGTRLWSPDLRRRKLALLVLAELLFLGLFGVLSELRVYSGLVPFIAVLFIERGRRPAAP